MNIDWAYLRKGWASCNKAQAVFAEKNITITTEVNAGKEKIAGDDAWNLLQSASEIVIGRGKKFSVFDPAGDDQEAILKQALGRTGNLRAPTLKLGKKLIIGFSEDMYAQHLVE